MFFVNKRFIKDKTLSASAEQAFKGLLPIGKFGFIILNLEVNPRKIDVNVHPAKLEIRFQEEQKVFKAVYHAIREGLLKGDLIKNTEKEIIEEPQKSEVVSEVKSIVLSQEQDIEDRNIQNIAEIIPTIEKHEDNSIINMQETQRFEPIVEEYQGKKGLFSIFKKKNEDIEEKIEKNAIQEIFAYKNNDINPVNEEIGEETTIKEATTEQKNEDFEKMYSQTFGIKREEKKDDAEKVTQYSLAETANISVFEDNEEYNNMPVYKYCGSVFSTYIIIEMGDEMYIIDQHAAHERVMYEEIKKNYYKDAEKESQIMLLPDIITLSHKEKSIVKENVELFRKAGFMLEEFGENTIRLIGVPAICMDMDTKELFLEILDTIDTVAITAKQEKEDKFIATIACKAAVKANMALTKEEVDTLMKKLLILPNPFTCPHGRPTAIKMDKMDIERKFNRRK